MVSADDSFYLLVEEHLPMEFSHCVPQGNLQKKVSGGRRGHCAIRPRNAPAYPCKTPGVPVLGYSPWKSSTIEAVYVTESAYSHLKRAHCAVLHTNGQT